VGRLFWIVAAIIFVDLLFFAAVTPLLPMYADELGLSKSAVGVLSASYPAGAVIGSVPAGWLTNRLGTKRTLLVGLAILAATSVAFGLGRNIYLLDTARFIQGFGGAFMWTAGMAWLVQASPPERRGEVIGASMAIAVGGILLGPVLGVVAGAIGTELAFPAVAVLAGILAARVLTLPGGARFADARPIAIMAALRDRPLLASFWLFCLPAVFAGVLEVLAPLHLAALGASAAAIGAAFLVGAALEAVLSAVMGRLSDSVGRYRIIRGGIALAVVAAVVMPLPRSALLLSVALVFTIAALGTFWAPAMALVSDASDRVGLDQAGAFALANIAWGVGHMTGGAGGAALADLTRDAVPYAVLAILCAGSLLLVQSAQRRDAARAAVGPA
jgi:MFS family permease